MSSQEQVFLQEKLQSHPICPPGRTKKAWGTAAWVSLVPLLAVCELVWLLQGRMPSPRLSPNKFVCRDPGVIAEVHVDGS